MDVTTVEALKWHYRVVVKRGADFTIEQFQLKGQAEARFSALVCHDSSVEAATCDKGTMAYRRYDKASQPHSWQRRGNGKNLS